MTEMLDEISAARGRILPMVSKASDRKICIPPTRRFGKNTMATTIMPIPPIHCRIPRHNNNPCGKYSSLENVVDPVVVSADMDSNMASVVEAFVAPITNGRAPKMGKKAPKHAEHNAHGSDRKPFGQRPSKADLLARMKKAQAAMGGQDRPSDPEASLEADAS